MLELSRILIDQGIQEIWVASTHGVFVHGGLQKLTAVPQITEIVTTDTVYIPPEKASPETARAISGPGFRGCHPSKLFARIDR